jgi:TolB-like protein/Tfp pilus assembly protein PilF
MATQNGPGLVRFGRFEFTPGSLELRRSGRVVRLAPQPTRLLEALLASPGQLVTRDDLRAALWSRDTFVDFEAGLNYCLGRLRAVLGDDVRSPRYIETVPRRGYRFVAEVERVGEPYPTLAVLPFDNLGGDPSEEYLSDGVSDGLITELGKIASLRVISRQSALAFKGSRLPIGDIARQLRASTLVEGSVIRHGDRLRITAQLIEVEPERHLWSESYEGDARDFLGLLSRVARAIAGSISAVLAPEEEARFAGAEEPGHARVNPEAHAAFLRGCFHLGKWSGVEIERGLACLHEALAINPAHAAAHAATANSLLMLGYWGHMPWRAAYAKAREAAVRAVDLDRTSSQAHAALAFVRLLYEWDFTGCEAEVRRAIETGPSNEQAHMVGALYESWIRDDQEAALAAGRTALALDPVSPFTNSMFAWLLLFARRYEEAGGHAERTVLMYPDALQAHVVIAWCRLKGGDVAGATSIFERAVARSPDAMTFGFLGHSLALAGRAAEALSVLDRLLAGPADGVRVKAVVAVLAGLGQVDAAFEWCERGLASRDAGLLSLRVSPPFDPLAGDPRFGALVERIGLPHGAAGRTGTRGASTPVRAGRACAPTRAPG